MVFKSLGMISNDLDVWGLALPEAHGLIFTTSRKRSYNMRVPAQTDSFLLMANKLRLGTNDALWSTAVLASVENKDPRVYTHCGYNIWILRLIPGFVDLSRMIDLLLDCHLNLGLFTRGRISITANLPSVLVIVDLIRCNIFGEFDGSNLEIILSAVGGMCSDEEAVDSVILPSRS